VDFGANVFGSITQVNERLITKPTIIVEVDLIKVLKKSYEEILRGIKGLNIFKRQIQ
jgi:penicillin-binding protein 2